MQLMPDSNTVNCTKSNIASIDHIVELVENLYEVTDACEDKHSSLLNKLRRLRNHYEVLQTDAELRILLKRRAEL